MLREATRLLARFANIHPMDVRSIEQCQQKVSHETVAVWWLVGPEELRDATTGGYLEYVTQFEVAGGDEVELHSHPSYEFYLVLSGRGVMTVDGESRDVYPGDLICIPPGAVHGLRPASATASISCFSFATSLPDADSHYRPEGVSE